MKGRFLVGFGLACLVACGGELALAVRGRAPEYAIVRAADASPSVKYAAEELREFTERLTGVRLPIVEVAAATSASLPSKAVFLNMSRLSSQVSCPLNLGDDGFSLKAVDGDLLVTGGNRGVLYGVYELLERYGGCRWYASWHTVVPARDSFSVPDDLDDAQSPAFPHREPFWWDMFNGDFAARNRANGPAMRVGAKHGGPAGRFGGGLGNCHTFNRLLPPEKYFDAHPEYFSMVKGKRLKERTQLCLTNPDVLRIVTSNVLACIRRDPTADYYGVSQNDWYNYCECPACAAVDAEEESHAGTMVRFVNAIAEAVEKEFPDKIIETLAYQYTRKPPKKTKLRHNVMPCLCTIECDFSRPLPDSRYHQNVKFVEEIKAWHAQASRLYVWDYVTDFHCYPYPFPDAYALQGNVQFFRDNGVYALFEQGDRQGCNAGFAELKAWLLAKWMWNPDRPMKPLLDDFFAGFYGAGAPFVREYFEELHRLQIAYTSADTNRWLNCHQDIPSPDIPAEFWDRADALLEKAAAAVKGDKTLEFNVRTARFGVDYVRLEHFRKQRGSVVDFTGGSRSCATATPGGSRSCASANKGGTRSCASGRAGARPSPQAEIPQLAHRALAFVDEVKHMRLCSSLPRQEKILSAWRRLADGTFAARTDGVAEDEFLHLLRLGDGNERVADPLAEDGHAAKLTNPQPRWSVNFPMSDAAFAPGRRYAVQMRLRADLTPGRKGPAVTAGIYDPKTKKYACTCAYPAEKLSGDYAWYTIGTFDPSTLSESAYLYVGDGYLDKKGRRFVPALYLDKIRFVENSNRVEHVERAEGKSGKEKK